MPNRRIPAIARSSTGFVRSSDGTRPPSFFAPTRHRPNWADISPVSSLRRHYTIPASRISGTRQHSHLIASTIPNCICYDPTYSYEVAVIVRDGLRRMIGEQEDVYYYLTTLNENYEHPAMPKGVEGDIIKGMYRLRGPQKKGALRVQLLGSGAILREVLAGADLLEKDFGVVADIWSVTSFSELRREALEVERWNMLNPLETPRKSHIETCLGEAGPTIASTDYMKLFADQIRPFVKGSYRVLGTDGFGRSDYRSALRAHFEIDRHFVAVAALKSLADENKISSTKVAEAIRKYGIDPAKPSPVRV
ncbi:MAG: hypothetical protein J0H40_22180 [Rhizobiales bacterium]|nr:hypothetical protein [Hyphomicrobiales bacterium]